MHAAIVTGVSRGLGAALAAVLLERGFAVLGIGRASHDRLSGAHYRFERLDLVEAGRVDDVLGAAFATLAQSGLDSVCLLNNAATVGPVGVLGKLRALDLANSISVNLAAVVALSNLFCRVFADAALPRRVINVSSGAAQTALPGESLYCIAKAGMEMLTRVLAAEQPTASFRAVTVRPGVIDTDMQAFARAQSREDLPSVDLFQGFYRDGRLVAPDVVAAKIVARLVEGEVEHGRTYLYQDL